MKIVAVQGIPRLHTTPLAHIQIDQRNRAGVFVELDDDTEKRFQLVFRPYQAVRVTTCDCFALPENVCLIPNMVGEICDSTWILELRRDLARNDVTANFLNKARHFIIPLQDDFLEVVAWDVTVGRPVLM